MMLNVAANSIVLLPSRVSLLATTLIIVVLSLKKKMSVYNVML